MIVAEFADAPAPVAEPSSREEFGKLIAALSSTLKQRGSEGSEGKLKIAVYYRVLEHLPRSILQKVVHQALCECEWMPAPAALLKMAESFTASEQSLHRRAQFLTQERRQRLQAAVVDELAKGSIEDLGALPQRVKQIGVARGYLFQRRDGSYAYRTAENLASDNQENPQ